MKLKKTKKISNDKARLKMLFHRRRVAVALLGQQALVELEMLSTRGRRQRARDQMLRRKFQNFGKDIPATGKELEQGYRLERESWSAQRKKGVEAPTVIAGSGIHTAYTGAWLRDENLKKFKKLKEKGFERLNLNDWTALDKLVKAHLPDWRWNRGDGTVHYVRQKDRYRYMVFRNSRGLLEDYKGVVITTKDDAGSFPWAYAMDQYGNLFVNDHVGHKNRKHTFWNHSSFNAGNRVRCAGVVQIDKGQLKYIDNASGHYKPSKTDLENCLRTLQDEEVDLSQTEVRLHSEGQTFTAKAFLEC